MRGFTLIELIAVLGAVGLIAFVVGVFLHWMTA